MPSIPQSLLWISLVVLWLFVLVPMLISKRDTVRRTSDVALATRVLNTGQRRATAAAPQARRRPSQRSGLASDARRPRRRLSTTTTDDDEPATAPRKTVVVMAAATVEAESEYLDVDVVDEDSGALPLGVSAQLAFDQEPELPLDFDDNTATFTVDDLHEVDEVEEADEPSDRDVDEAASEAESEDMTDEFDAVSRTTPDHDYEYVDDTSGVEALSDPDAPRRGLQVAGTAPSATSRRPPPPSARASSRSASGC